VCAIGCGDHDVFDETDTLLRSKFVHFSSLVFDLGSVYCAYNTNARLFGQVFNRERVYDTSIALGFGMVRKIMYGLI
jgi:hypothetical protein